MVEFITNEYKSNMGILTKVDAEENFYLFFGDSKNQLEVQNTDLYRRRFFETLLFGKKVQDVKFMIKENIWESNKIYTQYDDNVNLSGKEFFIVVYPEDLLTGSYNIFKCLGNNYGEPSFFRPVYNENISSQIYHMADGYVWKFMYEISNADYKKYKMGGYIPIIDPEEEPEIINGAIDYVNVENRDINRGYEKLNGTIIAVSQPVSGLITVDIQVQNISQIKDYYLNRSFYVTNQHGQSENFVVESYTYVSPTVGRIVVKEETFSISISDTFLILPRIVIEGDGSGCKAIANIIGDKLRSVIILNGGSNYTSAIARVVKPSLGFTTEGSEITGVEALLRPIIGSVGGHGSDLKNELFSDRVLVYDENTIVDNTIIPTSNTYSKIAMVYGPEFTEENVLRFDNRIQIELENSDDIALGDTLIQISGSTKVFEANVHEIDGTTIWVDNYLGPYVNYEEFDNPLIPTLNLQKLNGNLFQIAKDEFDEYLIEYPIYVQKTGKILYINSFENVERTSDSFEKYKILLNY